ncbi:hypothetical protein ACLQ25_28745 [Micromonospora sp. DT44]
MDSSALTPAVNQIELHPGLQQDDLRAFHRQHGIPPEPRLRTGPHPDQLN